MGTNVRRAGDRSHAHPPRIPPALVRDGGRPRVLAARSRASPHAPARRDHTAGARESVVPQELVAGRDVWRQLVARHEPPQGMGASRGGGGAAGGVRHGPTRLGRAAVPAGGRISTLWLLRPVGTTRGASSARRTSEGEWRAESSPPRLRSALPGDARRRPRGDAYLSAPLPRTSRKC